MKIKKVIANNRKKAFEVTASNTVYDFPYSRLRLKPSLRNPIQEVFADKNLGYNGFTYLLNSGDEDTIVMDQVLEYARDPEYLRRDLLYRLTLKAQHRLREMQLSKREIVRRMKCTPTQFYRLLDQRNSNKTIDQMVKLLAAMDCPVDLVFDAAA